MLVLCAGILHASKNMPPLLLLRVQLQAFPPRQLKYKGTALKREKLLGAGATYSVYQSTLESRQQVAVKVLGGCHGYQEPDVLADLAKAGCTCVPTVVGRLDFPAFGHLLQPVGTMLRTYWELSKHPKLFKAIAPLVDTLRKAYERNWDHRDVTPSNLLVVADTPGAAHSARVLLLDWWAVAVSCLLCCRAHGSVGRSFYSSLDVVCAQRTLMIRYKMCATPCVHSTAPQHYPTALSPPNYGAPRMPLPRCTCCGVCLWKPLPSSRRSLFLEDLPLGACTCAPLPPLTHAYGLSSFFLSFCPCRGFAAEEGSTVAAHEFCGSTRYASNWLLAELAGGRLVTAWCVDDLESLVSWGMHEWIVSQSMRGPGMA